MDERSGFEAWYRDEHPRLLGSMVVIVESLDEAREVVDEAAHCPTDLVTSPITRGVHEASGPDGGRDASQSGGAVLST